MVSESPTLPTTERSSAPGPWRWEVNLTSRVIELVGGKPEYDMTVMDFRRWGMGAAQPRFIVDGLLYKAEDFKRIAPDREHHARWFQLLDHPDANLIAAAPDLLAALKELLASQLAIMPPFEAGVTAQDHWADRRAKARNDAAAVIAKAEGKL